MFRTKYLDYAELTAQLSAWAKAHPDFVQLTSLGKSREGRDIPLLIIGPRPDEVRPAVWVDGNMHASEFCGSSAALAIAEDVIALHAGTAIANPLPAHMADTIKATLFYVVPRISPDGAEAVLKTGRYVRSHLADNRADKGRSYWQNADVDGDGQMGYMRQLCAEGELVELTGEGIASGVMVPRQPEDTGPFYRMYPEGHIVNFDGKAIPTPDYLADSQTDFNRNFPYQWGAEESQRGAGHFPGSEPETRALLEFVSAHPNIFTWVNFHTFGGVFLRPLGDKPDHEMDQGDLAVYQQVEAWAKQFTGYPMVSGYHEFQYEPGTPVRGILTDYAYHQRGCLAYGVELWDIFTRIGMKPRKKFIENYSHMERADLLALAQWDRRENQGRIFRPWRAASHPQIGAVELGGLDLRVGISNPSYEKLGEVLDQHSAAFLRVAALSPRISVSVAKQEKLAAGMTRLEIRVASHGYLGTHGIASAKQLPHVEPLRLTTECEGVRLAAPGEAVTQLGHLDGWGRGPYGGVNIFAPWTRGNVNEARVTLVAEGRGTLRVKVGSCRVGYQTLLVEVA
jgi:hypothetical protein